MSDQTPRTQEEPTKPSFIRVFEALRRLPSRSERLVVRSLEHTVTRRRPARLGKRQRGDVAEPPPVLDLVTEGPEDTTAVLHALVLEGGVGPVWMLPKGALKKDREAVRKDPSSPDTDAPRRANGRNRRRRPPEGGYTGEADGVVTVEELYGFLDRLVKDAFPWKDEPIKVPSGHRAPPPPRFAQVRSLLWLQRCNYEKVVSALEDNDTPSSGDAQAEVIKALREVRLESAREDRENLLARAQRAAEKPGAVPAPSRWELAKSRWVVYGRALAKGVASLSNGVNTASKWITFGNADDKILTPVSFVLSLFVAAAPFTFAFIGLAAQQANELVSLLVGALLMSVYLLTVFFFLLPWRPYRWLRHHRYVMRQNRTVQGAASDKDGGSDTPKEPSPARGARGRHRVHGVQLLRLFDDEAHAQRSTSKAVQAPSTHRIAVNALLDDLHREYSVGHRLRRGGDVRPVLIYDQRRMDRVGRYFVWLIEQERLRRGFPDPLLLVQVRDGGLAPLVDGVVDVTRYGFLPELDQKKATDQDEDEAGSRKREALDLVRRWTYHRYLSGVLGAERVITRRIPKLSGDGGEITPRGRLEWVRSVPVLVGMWTSGIAGVTAVAVLFGLVFLPSLAQASNPCVQDGVWQPQGITRKGDQCVGVTDGAFVFNDRLKEVSERVRDQNKAVEASGQPYVTIAHLAELDVADPDDPSLSGGQGELLGLAYQQDQHNRIKDPRYPRIKLLIANAGRDWEHSLVAAKEIVDRAGNERLGMNRPIAAVGFGHSVVPNSDAIKEVGDASITMVGTTATFDDVAKSGDREHSEFYFPISPANTRIAEQSAHWARSGVSWRGEDGVERGLEPHETAVAIASGETDTEGGTHEQYGPHLAREFIDAFERRGGRVWEGAEGLGRNEYDRGVLLYQNGESEDDTTYEEQLERLCTDDDPPDLLYYAGRSDDFTEFYRRFTRTGGEDCVEGRMTILGGDDVSKFVSDEEELIGNNAAYHSVFYTPLAPSGPWGGSDGRPGGGDQGFYSDIKALQDELFEEKAGEKREVRPVPKKELPSIAHAAVASDALLVVSEALPATGLTQEELAARNPLRWVGLDRPPFLRTQEQYEDQRDDLHSGIKGTRNLTGVSGYIEFDAGNDGNWYDGRMVQLVLVGPETVNPETGERQRQHVVQRCGMRNANTIEPGEECLPLGSGIGGRPT